MAVQIIIHNRCKRKRLERLARKTHNKIVFRRCQIILQLAHHRPPQEIAHNLDCDVSTIYRTRKAFLKQGESALVPKKSPGRPCKLTLTDCRRLDQTLTHDPHTCGKSFSNWNAKQLGFHLRLTVHRVTILRYLWKLGWRWRRPVTRIASPDPRDAAKAQYLRRLRRWARQGKIHLYYADEMDVALLPTLSGCWMRHGQQRQVFTPGQNVKQYVLGAVNYVTGTFVWLTWAQKNNVGFRQLLRRVLALHARQTKRIVIVADNFRIHKAKAVCAWLRDHRQRIRLYFLPTYAPHLNPIERVWRHFRRNVTDNYFFHTMRRLMAAVDAFLSELAQSPAIIWKIVA